MKITKSINSATNSCNIAAKPSTKIEESTNGSYLYITKHGLGPGTKPKDVKLIDSKDLSDYLTAIWLDRPLTSKELEYYDIYPETEIDEVLRKYDIPETSESLSIVTSATNEETASLVNENYLAQLIKSVDEKLPDTFVTYTYDIGDDYVTCTSVSPTQIAEYTVPLDDLSGVIEEDMEYILGAIDEFYEEDEESELVQDGRYEYVDSKTVLDFDGFTTEYTMYHDTEEDRYVFVFGDPDVYTPYDGEGYFDFVCDTLQEAQEWFEEYIGPGEDDSDGEYDDYDSSSWY